MVEHIDDVGHESTVTMILTLVVGSRIDQTSRGHQFRGARAPIDTVQTQMSCSGILMSQVRTVFERQGPRSRRSCNSFSFYLGRGCCDALIMTPMKMKSCVIMSRMKRDPSCPVLPPAQSCLRQVYVQSYPAACWHGDHRRR
jgi:hypothetical protein